MPATPANIAVCLSHRRKPRFTQTMFRHERTADQRNWRTWRWLEARARSLGMGGLFGGEGNREVPCPLDFTSVCEATADAVRPNAHSQYPTCVERRREMSISQTEPYGAAPGSQQWNGAVSGCVSDGGLTPVRCSATIRNAATRPGILIVAGQSSADWTQRPKRRTIDMGRILFIDLQLVVSCRNQGCAISASIPASGSSDTPSVVRTR